MPGLYGVCAASEYWFGKPVQRLSRNEAARLAAILPNPWVYSAQSPSRHVRQRTDWVLRQMQRLGPDWIANIE